MTRWLQKAVRCGVCNAEGEYPMLASTNEFGSADLDMRPPEMRRSTMRGWVQRCHQCAYCAPDLSEGPAIASEVITSPAYCQQRENEAYPELANSFLCWSLIGKAADLDAEAGWAAVNAAWVCDDAEAPSAADQCRLRASAGDRDGVAAFQSKSIPPR